MALTDSIAGPFIPNGIVDSIDGNVARPGAMTSLQNLIPSSTTPGLMVCRPAAFTLADLVAGGFTTATYISASVVVGTRVYGMVTTQKNPGFDEPFCYDTATASVVGISGVLLTNVPSSPATSGAWTPPVMSMVGVKIIVTHPGFSGTPGKFFGVIDVTTPSAPAWSSANTTTNLLPSVPTFVANFNNRAYFACGNVGYFSDVLTPTVITNATNQLTFGATDAITAMAPQPFFTTQSGGIAAALLVFKSAQIFQVTGDLALSTLSLNKLIDNVGTSAPRSPAVTPQGVMFLAADGVRTVTLQGQVSEPNADVVAPFLNPPVPSRVAAAYNEGFYRIGLRAYLGGVAQQRDYWWDAGKKIWNGPHTLPYDNIVPINSTFLVSSAVAGAVLQQSNVLAGNADAYRENGQPMTFTYQTVLLPEGQEIMTQKSLNETSIFMAFAAQLTFTANMLDPSGAVLGTFSQTTPFLAPTGGTNRPIYWATPIEYVRTAFQVTGLCANGLGLGTVFLRYQVLGYNNVSTFPSNTIPPTLDWGLVSDPNIMTALDWGSVIDAAVATVDFGTVP